MALSDAIVVDVCEIGIFHPLLDIAGLLKNNNAGLLVRKWG
jgi:hypothetical protein